VIPVSSRPGDSRPREALGSGAQQPPPVPAELGHRGVDPAQRRHTDLFQGTPHRRGRGHRPDDRPQVLERLEVADRLPTVDQDQGQVQQHLTTVIDRVGPTARQRG